MGAWDSRLRMNGARLWLAAVALQALLLSAGAIKTHRRSLPTQQNLPLAKGGWRPVLGSGGLVFGYGTAPLHAPSYRIQVPVLEYASSARPLPRDPTKLTSIAQSYRPTTLRSVPTHAPAASQPINTYLNPFALPNSHYKFMQNYPADSILIRNPNNPFAARPVFGHKYPQKYKQQIPNTLHYNTQQPNNIQQLNAQQINSAQQLNTVQPIFFGQYQTAKPVDAYGKPVDVRKQHVQNSGTEVFKPEVYKLPDADTASQSSQQVKTAQQQSIAAPPQTPKIPASPYPQYTYQESVLPPSILGTFGSFGVQSVKGRDPQFPTKTTYVPVQPTKQTVFNSFSFAPNFKTTPSLFANTTPKLQSSANQIHFGSTWNDFQVPSTQAPKVVTPAKIDPNVNKGIYFKPSPQDPFIKNFNDYKISTYNPTVQTTTFAYSNYHDYYQPQNQQNQQIQNYYDQQNTKLYNEKKKQKVHGDSVPAGVNQQLSQQYANPPKTVDIVGTQDTAIFRPTYEVTESYSDDVITHSSSPPWQDSEGSYYSQKAAEESAVKHEHEHKPIATQAPELSEEFAIVTEGDKGFENSLSYDGHVESQSRRPLGDDFEPIGKHKLKDYYYKVSTPSYDGHPTRRTKKPTDDVKPVHEVTTPFNTNDESNNQVPPEPLPTLPPNRHFKRPSSPAPETIDGEKIRKRNKIRRRRPVQGNVNRDTSTRKYASTTQASPVEDEVHTYRPRVRPTQAKPSVTTPTITTDLTTSANPTLSPTSPTIVKKKLIHRRPLTTTSEKYETTTSTNYKDYDTNKDSSIMKISASSRIQLPKISTTPYEYKTSETPDYSHKQDEKDTPTSDVAVDTLKTTIKTDISKSYSFHRDTKPIEAKLEPVIREILPTDSTKDSSESFNEFTTTTPRIEATSTGKILRPRLKNKFDRPRFSVKDYRNRLSSTTSSTEKPSEAQPKLRFPQRRPLVDKLNDAENTTERKKFMPKDPRHRLNGTEISEQAEKEIHSYKPNRSRQTTVETTEAATQKISSRVRNGSRRPRPTEEPTVTANPNIAHKRPLRKKIKDTDIGESVQDISVTETTVESKNDITSERTRSESAIMKIADKKHHDPLEHIFEHSKRVSDLTLAASKDYNTPGMFKTVSTSSRRIPSYFTIATDDPILPIEAFFPQINQKKES